MHIKKGLKHSAAGALCPRWSVSGLRQHTIIRSMLMLLLLFGAIISIAGCSIFYPRPPQELPKQPVPALDTVLSALSLNRDDLGLNCPLPHNDPFFFHKAGIFLHKPHLIPSFAHYFQAALNSTPHSLSSLLVFAADVMELPLTTTACEAEADGEANEWQGLPAPLNDAVASIHASLLQARRFYDGAFKKLTAEEQAFIKKHFEELLWSSSPGAPLTRREEQTLQEQALSLAAQVQRRNLLAGALFVATAIDGALNMLNTQNLLLIRSQVGANQITFHSSIGDIIIGGFGNNRYNGAMPALLIELGGDDEYIFTSHNPFSVIVDLSGNDTYMGADGAAYGAGIMGVGFLVDREGNDRYVGENSTWGAGLFGVGVMIDEHGDDVYIGHAFAEGAGAFGTGILCDYDGEDLYQSAMYSQGFGLSGGCGLFIDYSGNDTILARGGMADFREQSNAYQTCSQGFGLGVRGFAAGGIGLLYNGAGDDIYEGSYFCQGASYWFSIGMLLDYAGNDTYKARRYSQGAGIHSSSGALFDCSGNDTYRSWAVSQACGHDRSIGMLWDSEGDDCYLAEWLSQGSGNDSGRGLFFDEQGNDTYTAGTQGTQGCGIFNERWDEPSIGILVDGSGDDVFAGNGKSNQIWTCGKIGGGIDADGQMSAVSVTRDSWHEIQETMHGAQGMSDEKADVKEMGAKKRQQPTENGHKEWVVIPELEAPLLTEGSWERAASTLAGKGPSIIPALFQYMDIKDVSVARTLEETFKAIGRTDIERIHRLIRNGNVERSKKPLLLYVLGDLARAESKDLFISLLKDRDPKMQALALRGLYKLKTSPPINAARRLVKSDHREVRKYLAFSLQYGEDAKSARVLRKLQRDVDVNVRYAASAEK